VLPLTLIGEEGSRALYLVPQDGVQ
jgi:hypothetical protein